MAAIRNPIEWSHDEAKQAGQYLRAVGRKVLPGETAQELPEVRRIQLSDLRDVLSKGLLDFAACRTDVIFLCIIYPVIGLVLAYAAFNYGFLPLLFPLASGFALIGPLAAVGLYELSRRREQGLDPSWSDAFAMMRTPSFGAILVLGLVLVAIFLIWLAAAYGIYALTLGPEPPASIGAFVQETFTTPAGWTMILVGMAVGLLFAVLVLSISVVSFPLLIDRDIDLGGAVATSVRAVSMNPVPMAGWGLIVAGGLVLGSLPVFVGLIVILPVLGHATWYLYRKVVV